MIIILILLLLLVVAVVVVRRKWLRASEPPPTPRIEKVVAIPPPPPPKNDHYTEPVVEEPVVVLETPVEERADDWAREQADRVMRRFKIDHAHREIIRCLHNASVSGCDECGMLFAIFSQCEALSAAKKMEVGTHIIWRSHNQEHIDRVYEYILGVAGDDQENPRTRANALEILMRSNNRLYTDRSKRIMASLREHERTGEMEQLRRRMDRIQQTLQQRIPINPSTLRRDVPPPPNQLRGTLPLTPEEVQIQHALMDQYRRLERRTFNATKNKASVYDDPQNVHNQKINETVVRSAQELVHSNVVGGGGGVGVEQALRAYYPHYERDKKKIENSLNRIRTDPSKFHGGVTIGQVFDKVVGVIEGNRHKEEMWKRLGEELTDMDKLCATGHLSRVVNVIQGFDGVPDDFQIRMDPKDEVSANIANYITKSIQDSGESDKLLESMIDPEDRTVFLEFVSIVLKPKVGELREEYKGLVEPGYMDECVRAAIRNYIKDEAQSNLIAQCVLTETR